MNLPLIKSTVEPKSGDSLRQAYESNYLMQNQRFVGFIALAAVILQILLLIPDLNHINQASGKTIVLLMRIVTSFSVLVFSWYALSRPSGHSAFFPGWYHSLKALLL